MNAFVLMYKCFCHSVHSVFHSLHSVLIPYYLCITVYILFIVYVTLARGKAQLQLVINK
jgi:hypothetical protein